MPFYSRIRIEPQKHLEEICKNPYLVFSTDFLYYLSKLHDVDWSPIMTSFDRGLYQPHPLSPCTENVKTAMHLIHAKSGLCYELLYEELVPAESDNKLELFIDRLNKIYRKLSDNPLEAYFTLLHAGRWTVTFYKHGTKDAAHLAPYLMADSLKKIIESSSITAWFNKIDVIAEDLVELLKSEHVEGFAEEYSHYFEELDLEGNDDFDECSFCVCGLCEDTFEDAEADEEATDYYDYHESDYSDDCENSNSESEEFVEVIESENEENRDCD